MQSMRTPPAPRQLHPIRITLVLLALVLLWDLSGWDLVVMHWFGSPQGFALKENWWLSAILHTRGQQLAVLAYLFLLLEK